ISGVGDIDFIIYPNPTGEAMNIRVPTRLQNTELYLNIVDIHGRYLQRSVKVKILNGEIILDVSQYEGGHYTYIIVDRDSRPYFPRPIYNPTIINRI
ncbi:MAG: T9SS type A sorting domain-containing protein, partial [Bacteroidales bacterium]|nr:T9SS type A sorting domain-containing protein [Bacteroidales bacterium]